MLARAVCSQPAAGGSIGGFDTPHGAKASDDCDLDALVAYAEHVADEIDRYR